MLANQNSSLLSRLSWNAVLVGTIISLGFTPLIRWFVGAVGFPKFNLWAPSPVDLHGWILLVALWAVAIGVGAFAASYVNRPLAESEGVFQGFMIWAVVCMVRWILALFNLTLTTRVSQQGSPSASLILWIGFFGSFAAAFAAMYGGWLGTGSLLKSYFKRNHHHKATMRPASQP